jgi:hypothetical protein
MGVDAVSTPRRKRLPVRARPDIWAEELVFTGHPPRARIVLTLVLGQHLARLKRIPQSPEGLS